MVFIFWICVECLSLVCFDSVLCFLVLLNGGCDVGMMVNCRVCCVWWLSTPGESMI